MARRVERVQQAEQEKPVVEAGPFTLSDVKQLVEALEGTDVTSFVWSRSGDKVVIRRGEKPATVAVAYPSPAAAVAPLAPLPPVSAPAAAAAAPAAAPAPAPKAESKPGVIVTSPFVGTFYRAPSPESPPFVDVGAVVKKGQVLCIVEAMKLMNEIEAEVPGKIAEILVENATPVEFGEPLFRIEPA
ncbi:acetyl-CoA carboxylase biotin carboxyl carrier protein [Anaeromyxobacter paludicola]|uniref:Biotin carboxyl carrier protein of acetyl-CoA carboxylase n=1 Tax=Anaeromyxobacter paludicola TaxID=2918171 RepID=A0ABM7XAZ8_9BACT|nr:acetyl-CoA carboxylase biotin carboxyl carrier protein [Anaeromyxobacter paludicola]BDG09020.1 acetyl-CoA carboxylase, biotin carboxyl carrier protein [Anaeromyxobacter paludicola]